MASSKGFTALCFALRAMILSESIIVWDVLLCELQSAVLSLPLYLNVSVKNSLRPVMVAMNFLALFQRRVSSFIFIPEGINIYLWIYISRLTTLFFQHVKSPAPLHFCLHGFEWEIRSQLNCCSPIGNTFGGAALRILCVSGFQQFEYDTSGRESLWVYSLWGLLSFLILLVYVFLQIWEASVNIFSSLHASLWFWWHRCWDFCVDPQVPRLSSLFKSSSLWFRLGIFYWSVSEFTDSFFFYHLHSVTELICEVLLF